MYSIYRRCQCNKQLVTYFFVGKKILFRLALQAGFPGFQAISLLTIFSEKMVYPLTDKIIFGYLTHQILSHPDKSFVQPLQ